jgi:hypothetical protein
VAVAQDGFNAIEASFAIVESCGSRGRAEQGPASAVRVSHAPRSTSTSASSRAAIGLRPSQPSARFRAGSRTIPGRPSPSSGGWSRKPWRARPPRART